jgi:hypothetical protein
MARRGAFCYRRAGARICALCNTTFFIGPARIAGPPFYLRRFRSTRSGFGQPEERHGEIAAGGIMSSDEARRPAIDKIAEYRGYAAEAKTRAGFESHEDTRRLYLSVSASWTELADELERAQSANTVIPLPAIEASGRDETMAEIRRLKARAHHARQLAVHVPDPATAERLGAYAARLDDEAAELERHAMPGHAKSV